MGKFIQPHRAEIVRRRDRDGCRHCGRASAGRRIHAEIRQRPAGGASDQQARQGSLRRDQAPRPTAGVEIEVFPNSQLGGSHRHAQPGALRRDRHLHHRLADRERGADRGDPAASRSRFRPSTACGPRSTATSARISASEIGTGIGLVAFEKMWDNGYPPDHHQQQADQQAGRSQGHEAARAGEPAVHLDVQGARHLADRDQFRRGLHGAADQVVDGQENPLALIDAAKFYEVQKFCSLTGHMWEGFWMVANRRYWEQLAAGPARNRRSACSTKAP